MLIIRSRAHKYRQPRVLLVSPQPFYEDRGTPIAVSYVARALGELGCEVDLLAFPVGEHVELPGVRIHRSTKLLGIDSVPVGFSSRKAVLDVGLFQRFSQMLDSRVYDAVHAVEEAAYMAKVLCGSRGVPFVFDMASAIPEELKRHAVLGRQPLQWLLRVAEQRVLKGAAHVICSMGLASRVAKLSPLTACSEWRYPVFDQLSSGDV
ncbi:MAG: glycosyltransferase, partial [Steroidobacteraceae bacterium]